jgi:hypothetical protein
MAVTMKQASVLSQRTRKRKGKGKKSGRRLSRKAIGASYGPSRRR